jgi:hypothetical protein
MSILKASHKKENEFMNSSGSFGPFGKDLGLIHELLISGNSLGVGKDFWAKLAHDRQLLAKVRQVVDGCVDLKINLKPIDFSVRPAPKKNTWTSHRGMLIPEQHGGFNEWGALFGDGAISPLKLAKPVSCQLGSLDLLNSNHLDFFLAHPSLMPFAWQNALTKEYVQICFIGTVFYLEYGNRVPVIRYLWFNDEDGLTSEWTSLNVVGLGENKQRGKWERPWKIACVRPSAHS